MKTWRNTLFFILYFSFFTTCPAQIISTIAGNGVGGYSGNGGLATSAEIAPNGMTVDIIGNVYISDADTTIRKINTSGIISAFAGIGVWGYSGDGGLATNAELYGPSGISTDNIGNMYIADTYNNVIRKVNTSGIITTFAGNGFIAGGGWGGYYGDGGPATAAELYHPKDVAVDKLGNVYIADKENNVIRKVDTSGIISTFAGNGYGAGTMSLGGFTGDGGPATIAEFFYPCGVAADNSGNIYIADYDNERIREVNTSGTINTVAGIGTGAYSGDAGPATSAEIGQPWSVAVDDSGNFYIPYGGYGRIRKVNTSGIINTIAGIGIPGFSGDEGPATSAEVSNFCLFASLDTNGNIYITDGARVRKIWEVLNVSASTTANVNCNGGSTGSAVAIASEGTNPYTYFWFPNGGSNAMATGLGAGIYTVMVTDSNNLKGSAIVTITQPPALNIIVDSINATGGNCNGSAWVTVTGGTPPYSYLWTGGLTADTITNQCEGYYCSTVTDANGCIDSVCVTINVSTGVNNISNSSIINIFPDPNNGIFTIQSSVVSCKSSVEIYNVMGQKINIATLKQVQGDYTINMSSQPNGVYFYRVLTESGSLIGDGKVIIQK